MIFIETYPINHILFIYIYIYIYHIYIIIYHDIYITLSPYRNNDNFHLITYHPQSFPMFRAPPRNQAQAGEENTRGGRVGSCLTSTRIPGLAADGSNYMEFPS